MDLVESMSAADNADGLDPNRDQDMMTTSGMDDDGGLESLAHIDEARVLVCLVFGRQPPWESCVMSHVPSAMESSVVAVQCFSMYHYST